MLEGDEAPLPMAGVFEFSTLAEALAFYNSERYALIKAERREAQHARMFVVEMGESARQQGAHARARLPRR